MILAVFIVFSLATHLTNADVIENQWTISKAVWMFEGGLDWPVTFNGSYFHGAPVFRQFDPATGNTKSGVVSLNQAGDWIVYHQSGDNEEVARIHNCRDLSGNAANLQSCTVSGLPMRTTLRTFEPPLWAMCIPTPGTIRSAGTAHLMGTFKTLYDCALEAQRKFKDALTAVQRFPYISALGEEMPCYAYVDEATLFPTKDTDGNWSCLIKNNRLPGLASSGPSEVYRADSVEACIHTADFYTHMTTAVSWNMDTGECQVFSGVPFVDTKMREDGWISSYITPTPKKATTTTTASPKVKEILLRCRDYGTSVSCKKEAI